MYSKTFAELLFKNYSKPNNINTIKTSFTLTKYDILKSTNITNNILNGSLPIDKLKQININNIEKSISHIINNIDILKTNDFFEKKTKLKLTNKYFYDYLDNINFSVEDNSEGKQEITIFSKHPNILLNTFNDILLLNLPYYIKNIYMLYHYNSLISTLHNKTNIRLKNHLINGGKLFKTSDRAKIIFNNYLTNLNINNYEPLMYFLSNPLYYFLSYENHNPNAVLISYLIDNMNNNLMNNNLINNTDIVLDYSRLKYIALNTCDIISLIKNTLKSLPKGPQSLPKGPQSLPNAKNNYIIIDDNLLLLLNCKNYSELIMLIHDIIVNNVGIKEGIYNKNIKLLLDIPIDTLADYLKLASFDNIKFLFNDNDLEKDFIKYETIIINNNTNFINSVRHHSKNILDFELLK